MKPIKILITGVGGGGHGEQILKAIRLAKTPYHIVGGDISKISKGLTEVDEALLLPRANDPNYIPTLLRICEKKNIQALFHGSEPELKVLSQHRKEFSEKKIFLPINPQSVIDICMDKTKTIQFLKEKGFQVPETRRITSKKDLEKFNALPAILKPSIDGGGSNNVFLAQTEEELSFFGEHLLSQMSEFIIQEYVGTPESEYTVGVLMDMDGNLINSIALKRFLGSTLSSRIKMKNKSNKKELGSVLTVSSGVSQGEIGPFPNVTKVCEKIAVSIGARAALNIQCRLVGDQVYPFEINPRFSGTTSLRAMVGYNEPDVLIRRHLLGEKVESHFKYESGTILRGLSETLLENDIG